MSRDRFETSEEYLLAQIEAEQAYNAVLQRHKTAFKAKQKKLAEHNRSQNFDRKESAILEKFRKPVQERRSFWNWLFYA